MEVAIKFVIMLWVVSTAVAMWDLNCQVLTKHLVLVSECNVKIDASTIMIILLLQFWQTQCAVNQIDAANFVQTYQEQYFAVVMQVTSCLQMKKIVKVSRSSRACNCYSTVFLIGAMHVLYVYRRK